MRIATGPAGPRNDGTEGGMAYCVYILANATNVAIYTGMTNDLVRRVYEHNNP